MKSYVGVRIVSAEPEKRGGKDGYRVVRQDGKTSWVPKEQFEERYSEFDCAVAE